MDWIAWKLTKLGYSLPTARIIDKGLRRSAFVNICLLGVPIPRDTIRRIFHSERTYDQAVRVTGRQSIYSLPEEPSLGGNSIEQLVANTTSPCHSPSPALCFPRYPITMKFLRSAAVALAASQATLAAPAAEPVTETSMVEYRTINERHLVLRTLENKLDKRLTCGFIDHTVRTIGTSNLA